MWPPLTTTVARPALDDPARRLFHSRILDRNSGRESPSAYSELPPLRALLILGNIFTPPHPPNRYRRKCIHHRNPERRWRRRRGSKNSDDKRRFRDGPHSYFDCGYLTVFRCIEFTRIPKQECPSPLSLRLRGLHSHGLDGRYA